jgi:4-amino-4-deoxy-L-arabinose transferase-like glycosyltransferase
LTAPTSFLEKPLHFYSSSLLVTLVAGAISFWIGFDGLYGQDSYAYLMQLKSIENHELQNQFYPPVYAFAGSILNTFLHNGGYSLQWVSLLSWWGSAVLLFTILKANHTSRHTTMLVVVCFLFCPLLTRMGVLAMSDALSAFMGLLAVYCGLYSKHKFRLSFFFIFASLAVLTRYALAVVLIPILVNVLVDLYREKSWRVRIFSGVGILIGTLMLWFNFEFFTTSEGSVQHNWLRLWNIGNFFARDFSHQDGTLHYSLPNLLYVFQSLYHPKFFLLFLPCLPFIRKEDFQSLQAKLVCCSILLYLLFLAGIPFQNERFLLPSFPFVIILFFPALDRLCNRLGSFSSTLLFLIGLQLFISWYWLSPILERNKLERSLAKNMTPFQGVPLYSFDVDIALEARGLQFEFRNLWKENYSSYKTNGLVLFNPSKFETQWKGKNPMLNWEKLSKSEKLKLVAEFEQGWKLYRISN